MKENELFNMKKSIVIKSSVYSNPRLRAIILTGRQGEHEVYIYQDNDKINFELMELLNEYGYDYNVCPKWLEETIFESFVGESIVIFEDNKYMKVMEYDSSEDINKIVNIAIFNNRDDMIELDKDLIKGKIIEEEPIDYTKYIDSSYENGIKNFVKRKGHNCKNR